MFQKLINNSFFLDHFTEYNNSLIHQIYIAELNSKIAKLMNDGISMENDKYKSIKDAREMIKKNTEDGPSRHIIDQIEKSTAATIDMTSVNVQEKLNYEILFNPCRLNIALTHIPEWFINTPMGYKVILIETYAKNIKQLIKSDVSTMTASDITMEKCLTNNYGIMASGMKNIILREHLQKLFDTIVGYTQADYENMNKITRGLSIEGDVDKTITKIAQMDFIFDNTPSNSTAPMRLFRGIKGGQNVGYIRNKSVNLGVTKDLNIGDIVYDTAFQSTSTDINSSLYSEFFDFTTNCCLFTFLYPSEFPYITTVIPHEKYAFGFAFTETEIILPRGMMIKVMNIKTLRLPYYDTDDKPRTVKLFICDMVSPIHNESIYYEWFNGDAMKEYGNSVKNNLKNFVVTSESDGSHQYKLGGNIINFEFDINDLYKKIYSNIISIRNINMKKEYRDKYGEKYKDLIKTYIKTDPNTYKNYSSTLPLYSLMTNYYEKIDNELAQKGGNTESNLYYKNKYIKYKLKYINNRE